MNKGFTLLELIICVIIIGVLAGLALPRFVKTVEGVRATEAIREIRLIKYSMDRCFLIIGGGTSYEPCAGFNKLDIEDPSSVAGSHFKYSVFSSPVTSAITEYGILAVRNTLDSSSYAQGFVIMGYGTGFTLQPNVVGPGGYLYYPQNQNDGKIYWAATPTYKGVIPRNP